ncbi:MAG: indole-3-glycerol phosphate synthase TrpC [Gemmatimonadaceae bacterium]
MTEAQAPSAWTPPTGTLGELTDEARARAATLRSSKAELERRANGAPAPPPFAAALRGSHVSVIAELKRSSPSKGVINAAIRVESQLDAYERGGAAAASILTEPTRFSGSNDDLVRARATVRIPLLKKDFHVDPLQIVEAKALGASAALVIARAVNPPQALELFQAARDVGIEILMEIRTEAELDLALSLDAKVVGVNNRNLETLEIDPDTAARLIPLIPARLVAVAESGVRSVEDVRRMAEAGADAVLVGSAISASADPEAAVRSLTGVARGSNARKD